jgi:hypothetical protein
LFLLYGFATFLGAALLFLVEPMAAKALLPVLGGTAGVWTVSLVFYQAALLAGYAYAHVAARFLSVRHTAILHAGVIAVAALLLPWRGPAVAGPGNLPPSLWVLGALASSVGAPFFVLAATGPLLQRWMTAASAARDPYPLYAISNTSSLAALIAYPWLVERYLPLAALPGSPEQGHALTQHGLWSGAFLVFAALVLTCAAVAARSPHARSQPSDATSVSWRQRAAWAGLSAIPAAAMMGTTQVLTTDVASVPLVWVLPLGIYLVSFVVAFAAPGRVPMRLASGAVAVLVLAVLASQWIALRPDPRLAIPLYLAALFAVGVLCHGRLAEQRPPAREATELYLFVAAGGAAGSLACGLLAPLVFRSVAEYPLALILACLARPAQGWRPRLASAKGKVFERHGWAIDLVLVMGLTLVVKVLHATMDSSAGEPSNHSLLAEALAACTACAVLAIRPVAFAAGVALLFATAAQRNPLVGHDLLTVRNFFGVLRVKDAPGPVFMPRAGPNAGHEVRLPMHELYHGTTLHGIQVMRSSQMRLPTTYYYPSGPIGRLVAGLRAGPDAAALAQVGIIGLGVGSLAAYAEPGEHFTFFEIDPAVVQIARDPALFSYLRDCEGTADVMVSDGRIALAGEPDGRFGLLVIDAFSSDAVPVHLLTREALALALRKLRPGGLVTFHLSSGFFDLSPVVAEAAASLDKEGLYWDDVELSPVEAVTAKQPSRWAVVASDPAALAPLQGTGPWVPLASQRRKRGGPWLWTDRYSSPLAALR